MDLARPRSPYDHSLADTDDDDAVTFDEFFAAAEASDDDVMAQTGSVVFQAFDPNSDGWITLAEYRQLSVIYHLDLSEADAIFARMDLDGDGKVSREEFAELWMQWARGDDEEAPGNWLFGRY